MFVHDVSIWKIRRRRDRPTKPYQLRWRVGMRPHSATFISRALADDYRADLVKAARRGELFDTETGLPSSMHEQESRSLSWYEFARGYVRTRWSGSAAKSRESMVDGLATATLALVRDDLADIEPSRLRAAMRWVLTPHSDEGQAPIEVRCTCALLSESTLPVAQLADPLVVRRVWEVLGQKLDGTVAARETAARRRRVLSTALEYAVDMGELGENPIRKIKRKRTAHDGTVDRRVVVAPHQARELLTAVSYVGSWKRARGRRLVAFFATLYYAGLRPGEAAGLRKDDCHLPDAGWGLLTVAETRPISGKQWTDSGELHDRRGLKQRDQGAVREVPAPPLLVEVLRAHLEEFGAASDGRLFANERGGVLGSTTYSRVWEEARGFALTPLQVASPLAGRPYDLRHAALSTWLNGGVDPTDVAERAGNSVEVLLKRYAKCIDGRRGRNNRLIERALQPDAANRGSSTITTVSATNTPSND